MDSLRLVFDDHAQRKSFLKEAIESPIFAGAIPDFELDGSDGLTLRVSRETHENLINLASNFRGFTRAAKPISRPLFKQWSYRERTEMWHKFLDGLDQSP